MDLVALEDRREIERAVELLRQTLRGGARQRRLEISTPDGVSDCQVLWHDYLPLWAAIEVEGNEKQYWCCFGMRDPQEARRQRMIVQINSPMEGKNLRCQGAFAKDRKGHIYYLHTGGLGGGREGVGRDTFVGSGLWTGEQAVVRWADGASRPMFLIGKLGDASLTRNLASYVWSAAVFRLYRGAYGPEIEKLFRGASGIFVSHSSSDNSWCGDFVYALRKTGADVWFDEDSLTPGILTKEIERQITSRPTFILVLSPGAVVSDFVQQEMSTAIMLGKRNRSRIILPVLAAPCSVPAAWDEYVRARALGGGALDPMEAAGRVADLLTRRGSPKSGWSLPW